MADRIEQALESVNSGLEGVTKAILTFWYGVFVLAAIGLVVATLRAIVLLALRTPPRTTLFVVLSAVLCWLIGDIIVNGRRW